jgi:hypothetical protein
MATPVHNVARVLGSLVLLSWPAGAADPIVITKGLVDTNVGSAQARLRLEGDGFFLDTAASFGSPLAPLCSPCAAGTPVTLNGTYTQGLPFGGTLTINGATYTDLLFQGGSGTLVTPEVPLPQPGFSHAAVPVLGTVAGVLATGRSGAAVLGEAGRNGDGDGELRSRCQR